MRLRFGVIGCGSISGTHCQSLLEIEQAELVAVLDVVDERAKAAADRTGAMAVQSLEAMMPLVDAVTVCVPSGLHAEIGIKAALFGKHVVVEKPIDVKMDRAMKLVDVCLAQNVKLATISQHRFAEDVRALRESVKGGALGRILQCDIYTKWHRTQAYYDSGDWRGTDDLDGGCVMNQGIHYLDLGQWIMGGVKSVQGFVRTVGHRIEAEDTALAFLNYSNGAVGVLQVTTVAFPGFSERIEVHGTAGTAILEVDRLKLVAIDPDAVNAGLYGRGLSVRPRSGVSSEGTQPVEEPWHLQHRAQLADFVEAVLDGREPFLTGREALDPLRIIRAIYDSSREGGRLVQVGEPLTSAV